MLANFQSPSTSTFQATVKHYFDETYNKVVDEFKNGFTPIQDVNTPNSYFRSDDYIALYAQNKQVKLWAQMADGGQSKFPNVAGIFTE